MTDEQTSTAKQFIKDYKYLVDKKPIIVNMGDREIVVKRNKPVLHPHYKELESGNILFGIGTEYTKYVMLVIEIIGQLSDPMETHQTNLITLH